MAKNLTNDTRIIVTSDDMNKIKNLAYDASKDTSFQDTKCSRLKKCEELKNTIKMIDEQTREIGNVQQTKNKSPPE